MTTSLSNNIHGAFNTECPICYEEPVEQESFLTPCKHLYDATCFGKFLIRDPLPLEEKVCAVCRQKIFPMNYSETNVKEAERREIDALNKYCGAEDNYLVHMDGPKGSLFFAKMQIAHFNHEHASLQLKQTRINKENLSFNLKIEDF